jgi:hypothetical protein
MEGWRETFTFVTQVFLFSYWQNLRIGDILQIVTLGKVICNQVSRAYSYKAIFR